MSNEQAVGRENSGKEKGNAMMPFSVPLFEHDDGEEECECLLQMFPERHSTKPTDGPSYRLYDCERHAHRGHGSLILACIYLGEPSMQFHSEWCNAETVCGDGQWPSECRSGLFEVAQCGGVTRQCLPLGEVLVDDDGRDALTGKRLTAACLWRCD